MLQGRPSTERRRKAVDKRIPLAEKTEGGGCNNGSAIAKKGRVTQGVGGEKAGGTKGEALYYGGREDG